MTYPRSTNQRVREALTKPRFSALWLIGFWLAVVAGNLALKLIGWWVA